MDIVKYSPWLVPLILAVMIAATVVTHPQQQATPDQPAKSR